jgi:anhydro-N-acetylmuramic acid kinase
MAARPLLVLGLMSGTSADGIDGVLVRLSETPSLAKVQGAFHHHRPFTAEQRAAVFALFGPPPVPPEAVCRMNFALGEWFAAAALETLAAAGVSVAAVDVIGSHGQTVVHLPPGPGEAGSTLQLGEPAVIAERTGITTVADFRVRDVAAGGQGAPLVSYVDELLFRHPRRERAVLNLGGIANVTLLPPLGSGRAPAAFDTGPGNMVLDWLAQRASGGALRCDEEGRLAGAGRVRAGLLDELLAGDDYFAAPAPKTTGRERFGAPYAERLWRRAEAMGVGDADLLATATALTAETVAGGLRRAGFGEGEGGAGAEVIAGGGGTRNPVLMAEIERRLGGPALTTHAAYGIESQAKEALSFAILAAAAVRGQPNTVPDCTGARRAVVMGKILPGEGFGRLMGDLFGPGSGA